MAVTSGLGGCAQPVSTGTTPTAADCLFILRTAVGIESCTPACICDVNGDLNETATDALVCLRIAVGVDVPLACPCESTTTTVVAGTTTTTLEEARGVCCAPRSCDIVLASDCFGLYLGDSDEVECSVEQVQACVDAQTVLGACCSGGICTVTTALTCSLGGGTYMGDKEAEAQCSAEEQAICAQSVTTTTSTTTTVASTTTSTIAGGTGVCCAGGGCSITTREECAGTWRSDPDATTCSIAACAAPAPAPAPAAP